MRCNQVAGGNGRDRRPSSSQCRAQATENESNYFVGVGGATLPTDAERALFHSVALAPVLACADPSVTSLPGGQPHVPS